MSKEGVLKDTLSKLSEHFTDYLVIVRISDGLRWKYSDRTFAAGAVQRLGSRLVMEDQIAAHHIQEGDINA